MVGATARARSVVGLYGDPTVAWSVLLRARLTSRVNETAVFDRLSRHACRFPQLGGAPAVVSTPDPGATAALFATRPYADGEPLTRVAVGRGEPELILAAHHGAVDGLGLLGLLGVALDTELASNATGLGARAAGRSFANSAARRLGEAVFAPPARIQPVTGVQAASELFAEWSGARRDAGTAALVAAATSAAIAWNQSHGVPTRRVVAAVGASRRPGDDLGVIQDSAYLRLRPNHRADRDELAARLATRAPEPAFPAYRNRITSLAIRLLAPRLGSTFLVSNLGVVRAGALVRSLAFYPVASGRSGVAFGGATLGDTTTITVRARRQDFDAAAASRLLELVVSGLPDEAR
jgi:hypothetical protein